MSCVCVFCGRKYVWRRKSGHTRTRCNSCGVNQRRFKLKQKIVAYLGGKCSLCGYNKSVVALQAHHTRPELKTFNVSGSHCRSWKTIESELKFCVLLCGNCHAETEYGIIPVE